MTIEPSSPPTPPPVPGPAEMPPLSPSDERMWAMLAHLSILLNLVSGFLGIVAALIIYLIYKDRSRYVAYQSMQSFVFQLITWGGGGILIAISWVMSGILTAVFIGLLCMPFACLLSLLPLGAVVYGIVGGLQCNQGQDFRYWLVGDWMRGTLQA
jgi:uncharacterized Tic20 family protein